MTNPDRWTRLVTRVRAENPGMMTLEGTNSLLLRSPDGPASVVVDPGPDDEHIGHLVAATAVELILLTHHHPDHSESVARLSALTGAPVRAVDPHLCVDADPLRDGERIDVAGVGIEVVATPGHTWDSASFYLPDDITPGSASGSMVTGDTILGRGTTVIAQTDGALADYFESLERLAEYGSLAVLPGHGALLSDLAGTARGYIAHRRRRLESIRDALAALERAASTDPETVASIASVVYRGLDPELRAAAEGMLVAQLDFLATEDVGEQ